MGNPFLGLAPYGKKDARRFFGREDDSALMRDRVLSGRTTLLFAPSGAGKTSFLNANLLPELASDHAIIVCRRWSVADPSEPIIAAVAKKLPVYPASVVEALTLFRHRDDSKQPAKRCILVLDQFEEAFQIHAWTESFLLFLKALAQVINDRKFQVRVLISMREEFLGELSAFDSLVPDLFGNYYRLKSPSKDQARYIIEQTCALEGVSVDRPGLKDLLTDLCRLRRHGRMVGEMPQNTAGASERITDFVIPPFLQLACHGLWEERSRHHDESPFLTGYQRRHANAVLANFCRKQLEGLSEPEASLFARALEYLITKWGAKVSYESSALAKVLGIAPNMLLRLLQKLAEVRILRSLKRPDGIWFELYHDIYAEFLYDWKERTTEEDKRRLESRADLMEKGIPPIVIAEWERNVNPLQEFWVYLPSFLGAYDPEVRDKIIEVMAHNITHKATTYLYVVENEENLARLWDLVARLETYIRSFPASRNPEINVREKVRVLLLRGRSEKRVAGNGLIAGAITGLLHLGNCWIAVKGARKQGYEVTWDDAGKKVIGGRPLPRPKLKRIVDNLSVIRKYYEPPNFVGIEREADIQKLIDRSPVIQVKQPKFLDDREDQGTKLRARAAQQTV